MRLDQFIASTTPLSRKEAKRVIGQGRVIVDGQPCRQVSTHISTDARVTLDDEFLALPGDRYLMLNKPEGVVSATTDSDHPTVLDLLPANLRQDLHIAGRLDADTTGLLLLTSDGQWSHRVTSPRVKCPKTYRVTLSDPVTETALQQLRGGMELRNDPRPTKPAKVVRVSDYEIKLTIAEGRYHQVKRMLAATGNRVEALHRLSIGAIELDSSLPPGAFRALTEEEINSIP
ncbi:pseudouridine synthase [Marinobacter sp. NP-4(2019)]|uniref:pseudouridine synthase n=1 Tax=Marinobacter sp. NP-4(2019) TaxID=2488665 RepID=UPI000FC3E759|nr:pseudouridine synthase [Marinobacter sp. NP-4(2019)]AZT85375.1 pseudouridine synthase [Marinobacter sp. NP-4(2019)]